MPHENNDAMTGRHMQIGEAAERVGLSIRTIRHYDEAGLVVPSARSEGGFRLYTDLDLDRLQVIKKMKPLGFTLEEMRDLLQLLDDLAADSIRGGERAALHDRLATYHHAAQARVQALREQLATAEEFVRQIQNHIALHRR
jgi:DNA-binding transcriptional MerR regulator